MLFVLDVIPIKYILRTYEYISFLLLIMVIFLIKCKQNFNVQTGKHAHFVQLWQMYSQLKEIDHLKTIHNKSNS